MMRENMAVDIPYDSTNSNTCLAELPLKGMHE